MKEKEKIKAAINRPLDKKVRQEIETSATHRSVAFNINMIRIRGGREGVTHTFCRKVMCSNTYKRIRTLRLDMAVGLMGHNTENGERRPNRICHFKPRVLKT